MARFMVTRTLDPMSEERLEEVTQKIREVCADMGGIRWIRSHLTSDGRHSFCEFEAASESEVREHSERAGLPIDAIQLLGRELGP